MAQAPAVNCAFPFQLSRLYMHACPRTSHSIQRQSTKANLNEREECAREDWSCWGGMGWFVVDPFAPSTQSTPSSRAEWMGEEPANDAPGRCLASVSWRYRYALCTSEVGGGMTSTASTRTSEAGSEWLLASPPLFFGRVRWCSLLPPTPPPFFVHSALMHSILFSHSQDSSGV